MLRLKFQLIILTHKSTNVFLIILQIVLDTNNSISWRYFQKQNFHSIIFIVYVYVYEKEQKLRYQQHVDIFSIYTKFSTHMLL